MMDDLSRYGSRTLTAMFDTSAEAERAVQRLRSAGVPDSSIRVTQGAASSYGSAGTDTTTYSEQHSGFWDSLADFFFPDEDRYAYAEGLARGSQMVTVSGYDPAHYDTIIDILDDEGSVDLDARQSEWQQSGNFTDFRSSSYYDENEYRRTHRDMGVSGTMAGASGAIAGAASAVGGGIARAADAVGDALTGRDDARGTIYDDGQQGSSYQMAADMGGRSTADMGSMQAGSMRGHEGHAHDAQGRETMAGHEGHRHGAMGEELNEDGTVKVVEESIAVGKRAVEGGAVRVRSYVREEPVSAQVDLRQTRVFVERRPVDRAVSAGDIDLRDQVIEARETSEQAVVQKEARVVEEIGLRSETEVQTQTIQDTVRKTEVEIEDTRTGETTRVTGDTTRTGGSGTSGSGSSY